MQNNMCVSVIIPTFRRPEMLYQAILSVKKQTLKNVEIIVVDDCSKDETSNIIQKFPEIKYLCNECNSGPGFSRKRGLLNSSGKYLVFLDDDDYYTSETFFQNAVEYMERESECIFVAANATVRYEQTGDTISDLLNVQGEMYSADYLRGFPFSNKKPHSTFTTVFRKSALTVAEVDKMKMVNDMPIYMRCLTAGGKVFFMEDDVGIYRVHDSNISKAMSAEFIIENMEEKISVRELIKRRKLFEGDDDWWYEQVKVTVSYYVYGTHPKIRDFRMVQKWCEDHSDGNEAITVLLDQYRNYLIDYQICKFKSAVKKVLGMKS